MIEIKKQIILYSLVMCLVLSNLMVFCNAEVIKDDPKEDLRAFYYDALREETNEALEDFELEDLNGAFDYFYDEWDSDDDKVSKEVSKDKMKDNDYIDIREIGIKNLDEENATLYVEVEGDLEDTERGWGIAIWSNCDGDTPDVAFLSIYVIYNESMGGGGGEEVVFGYVTEDNTTFGESDVSNGGTTLELTFPSELWEEDSDCELRCIMFTPDDEEVDDIDYWYIDICPNAEVEDEEEDEEAAASFLDDLFFWLLILLLVVAIITILLLAVHFKKKRQNQALETKPRFKGAKNKK